MPFKIKRAIVAAAAALALAVGVMGAAGPDMHYHGTPQADGSAGPDMHYHG